MALWDVTLKETVTYRLTVEAEDEAAAKEKAVIDHDDGMSTEVDNSAASVQSAVLVSGMSSDEMSRVASTKAPQYDDDGWDD